LFALFFPAPCALCNEPLEEAGSLDVCAACWSELEPWNGPACLRCGLPFASERALDAAEPLCAECRGGEFRFDAARSFGVYRDQLRRAILHLKFRPRERWGKRLGGLLAWTWQANLETFGWEPVSIVPVPLHRGRQRERGFNQAEALARGLIAALGKGSGGLVHDPQCLTKTRATEPQTGLSPADRRENVRGAFEVPDPRSAKDKSLVLIDDVMTTGATLSACAAALKSAGAQRVVALTLARATPQFPDLDGGIAL
jgi:ComF family protein